MNHSLAAAFAQDVEGNREIAVRLRLSQTKDSRDLRVPSIIRRQHLAIVLDRVAHNRRKTVAQYVRSIIA
jgi:hypothetical protein